MATRQNSSSARAQAPGADEEAIATEHLTQRYGRTVALDDIALSVPTRSVVGLLGPNGAGKTTLMRTVATLMPVQTGSVHVLGRDLSVRSEVRAVRSELGYLPQAFTADESMRTGDYVGYNLWLRGVEHAAIGTAVERALERTGLSDRASTRLSKLSGGMRQRAGIAAATAGEPPLVLLDEPTVGLDPAQRTAFRAMVRELKQCTVLLSTHLVEDVVSLCQHVIVVNDGRIAYAGPPGVLTAHGESVDALEQAYLGLLRSDAPGGSPQ